MSTEDPAHVRWLQFRNRVAGEPDYLEEWYWEQCADCRHWCPLAGPRGEDWGVCQNVESPFDGRVRFEHDGCDKFASKCSTVS
jgi:hypothetical protein